MHHLTIQPDGHALVLLGHAHRNEAHQVFSEINPREIQYVGSKIFSNQLQLGWNIHQPILSQQCGDRFAGEIMLALDRL